MSTTAEKQAVERARRRFDAISDRARQRIYDKVLRHYQRNPNSPWSGAPLKDLERTIRQFYSDLGLEYNEVFRETLPPAMQLFYDRAEKELRKAGLRRAILGRPDSGRIKYFLESSYERIAMKTHNMRFQHIVDLRKLSRDVFNEISVTGATRREVSKRLLERALDIKGFRFVDSTGTNWPLKSYFNTLARTELMNAGRATYDDTCSSEGYDVMLLTVSGDPCPKCSRFEGRLFSLTGATPGLPTKDDLIAAGVFHPNCTHTYSAVPEYIMRTEYDSGGRPK
ncbi:phage minor capsid protein [uncultured Victivallis sp.]|uniref:phage minor capsid protein n=1 Tax=uncultured Victivallis sp. TaxID=354118 RepID=UPI00259A95A4|nr:phage minor capsid protein [uncultured Victivallis sp.]